MSISLATGSVFYTMVIKAADLTTDARGKPHGRRRVT